MYGCSGWFCSVDRIPYCGLSRSCYSAWISRRLENDPYLTLIIDYWPVVAWMFNILLALVLYIYRYSNANKRYLRNLYEKASDQLATTCSFHDSVTYDCLKTRTDSDSFLAASRVETRRELALELLTSHSGIQHKITQTQRSISNQYIQTSNIQHSTIKYQSIDDHEFIRRSAQLSIHIPHRRRRRSSSLFELLQPLRYARDYRYIPIRSTRMEIVVTIGNPAVPAGVIDLTTP